MLDRTWATGGPKCVALLSVVGVVLIAVSNDAIVNDGWRVAHGVEQISAASTAVAVTTSTSDMASDQVVVNIGSSWENHICVNATSSISCDVEAAQHGSRLNRDFSGSTETFHVVAYGS
ncbi:unnamed protein product [Prorocentrum cordatum]|uniref:Subtilisin n=1 Tax=Prorocentrum cordatum TaxID=2364126 RepID=A0ABN9TRV8_9DINO|nr:unnamed protein product [Polarella glacialis]